MQRPNSKQHRVRSAVPSWNYSAGFSLFELVVFIISVAIIYATAVNRFSEFPEAAERANFLAVTAQIQSGVSLETTLGVTTSGSQNMSRYDGANPIEMLLSPPSNYLGAMDTVDQSSLPRRSWYFDLSRAELVYLVNESQNVFFLVDGVQVATDEIRFRTAVNYRYIDKQTGLEITDFDEDSGDNYEDEGYSRRFAGVLMEPVTPYEWFGADSGLQEAALADQQS